MWCDKLVYEKSARNRRVRPSSTLRNVFLTTRSVYYYTPAWILQGVRTVFQGGIDLDPSSDECGNINVQAATFYTSADDGLDKARQWYGNIFVNPPFGVRKQQSMQGLFLERSIREYRYNSKVKSIILLLKVAVGYQWFNQVYTWPHCFLYEKVKFEHDGLSNNNPHGTVVVYLGTNVPLFCEQFGKLGAIPGFNSWQYTTPKVQ